MNNLETLDQLLPTILLLTKILNSFICQDLPEFIEDNQDQIMTLLLKYLTYNNDLVSKKTQNVFLY